MKYGQGLPPAGGWKLHITKDEYSPEHQDEYQRLWHREAERVKVLEAEVKELQALLDAELIGHARDAREALRDPEMIGLGQYMEAEEIYQSVQSSLQDRLTCNNCEDGKDCDKHE